ncbi:hypothetical protein H7347_10065 [Corynebacterium sp. zg-331]|uniref:hypothetical protein n=1 Tax=unclassified Corynebacterium TaxID=2624378 RepID=UPI00128D2E57|nr:MULTISPECIES: hypothetical protein [unclassified Corynebacterium]MBC3186903.1 hypothetical protein [Corynebacterium sp. zg-331]MPV53383.1 hypothetical protein [Corynebacterium sp. zg331]
MSRCRIIGASIMVSVLCAACATVTEPEHVAHIEQDFLGEASRPVPSELGRELRRIVDGAVAHHGGRAGLAVVSGGQVYSAGDPGQGAAWSTIKVPIAIAAYRAGTAQDDIARAAITYSDNDASVALWNSLGTSEEAEAAVQEVLSLAGDPTDVARQWSRGGTKVSFGEVSWPLSGQALFASRVRCIEEAEPVVELMGEITEEHKYGLGILPGAVFKGGWGPDDDGTFTMRQLGTVDGAGIAMYVHPEDETESEGRAMLDDMARGLRELLTKGTIKVAPAC